MTLATELVHQYRMAFRSIWNDYYWPNEDYHNYDSLAEFHDLKLPLFASMVSKRLARTLPPPSEVFGSSYLAVPRIINRSTDTIGKITVDFGSGGTGGTNWRVIDGPFRPHEISLTIVDLYNWNLFGWKDFPYYEVLIGLIDGHPEAAGLGRHI